MWSLSGTQPRTPPTSPSTGVRAATVFDDPDHLEEDGTRPEHGEERRRAIGKGGEVIVTVIFTDRPDRRRIISARRARNDERERYDQSKAAP
jgi:uncharacterized DUF497 family protein